MRNEDYVVIQGWMANLGLTDKQLKVYALIWGFSRDGFSRMRGSARYIADWAGCATRHAQRIIRTLEDLGLVAHEVVTWSNGKKGGVVTEFWAILPEDQAAPAPGTKEGICWASKERGGYDMEVVRGSRHGGRNPHTGSNSKDILSCGGGKNTARSRALGTTTTGFLFENENGLTPGGPTLLSLPFEERYFVEGWERLMREPKWQGKTPGQLELQLERFRDTGDPEVCAYCMDLAIRRGWDFIEDPSGTAAADHDKFMAYCDTLRAREEGAAA